MLKEEKPVILEMNNISKRFPGVLALDNVSLNLKKGEVLALVGENGAGKSTLLKILSGAYTKNSGEIIFEGKKIEKYTPLEAIDMGISIIYQELDNFKTLSVCENLLVNNLIMKKGSKNRVDWNASYKEANSALQKVTKDCDSKKLMSTLSPAQQQLVEIAKALHRKMKILVMDEPTSSLNQIETANLLSIVRKIADSGISVIYISHRMDEIFQVSDRIQVMRDGQTVSTMNTSDTDREEVISYMVGRKLDNMYPHSPINPGKEILKVSHASAGRAKDISFTVHRGEIVGLFGLMGAGRSDIVRGLFGDLLLRTGSFFIDGEEVKCNNPSDAIRAGLAYVPSERRTEGLMKGTSVKFNTSITSIDNFMKNFKIDNLKENSVTDKWIKELNIRTPSRESVIDELSGGNQQKVVLARWLQIHPKVLILNDPTRGIDVGAKIDIYKLMDKLCAEGIGILMISSELQETIAMSDRIVVMCEGRLTGEVAREEASQPLLMKLAVGGE